MMYLELIVHILFWELASEITVYAQSDAGRKRANFAGEGFDITIPGTIAISSSTGDSYVSYGAWRDVPQLEIYQGGALPTTSKEEYDRFKMSVPLVAGVLPLGGALTYEERRELQEEAKHLALGGDFSRAAQHAQRTGRPPGRENSFRVPIHGRGWKTAVAHRFR